MRAFFDRQADAVAEELLAAGSGTAETLLRPEWDQALVETVRAALGRVLLEGAASEGRHAGRAGHRSFAPPPRVRGQGRTNPEDLRLPLPAPVLDRIDAWLAHCLAEPFWGQIASGVRDDLGAALRASLEAGDNLQETAQRVRGALKDAGQARAVSIARTETTGALNAGHQAAREHLDDLGLIKGKEWLAILDSDTREDHRAANGQTVNVREDFVVGGERCSHPGDVRLSPGQRCGCRCAVVSVFKEADE